MKKILFFTLCIVLFQACKRCEDVLLGTVKLMPSSLVLLNSLTSKTLVFKDSLGSELRFVNNSGLVPEFRKLNLKQICTGGLGFGGGFEFLDLESQNLRFTTDLGIVFNLQARVIENNQVVAVKDTILYDVLAINMFNAQLTSISNQVELSKRGTTKPDKQTENVAIETFTLFGKSFKQVFNVKNGLKSNDIQPAEIWYNTTQGIVALRLLNGKSFVLDKIL